MKAKYFLIGFILFSFVAISVPAQAADYSIGIAEDNEFILEVKTFDEDLADDYLGEDDPDDVIGKGAELGAQKKIVITDVEEDDELTSLDDGKDCDGWKIKYDQWDWTDDTSDFEDDPDDEDEKISVFADPGDLGEDVGIGGVPEIVPTDIAGFLDEVDWDKDIDAEGSTLTIEIDEDDAKGWYPDIEGDLIIEYTFNGQGYRTNAKAMDEDGNVIYEIAAAGGIPGYEIPIFLGATAIATIGLIYIIMKRK